MYKVAFLNDEEFEKLPGSDMESKIGVAYPEKGEAYIRKSGSNLVDTFSMVHELEHLKGNDLEEHYDSENGCYYKKFMDVFKSAAPILASFIPGIGQIAGPVLGAATAFSGRGGGSRGQSIANMVNSSEQSPEIAAPATSQAAGGGANEVMGSVGGNGIKSLSNQPQFQDIQKQRYGNISGRSPLMDVFGGF